MNALRTATWLGVLFSLFLLNTQNAAADEAQQLGIGIRAAVQVGQKPAVLLQPVVGVKRLTMKLVPAAGGKPVSLSASNVGVQERRELTWNQPVGAQSWTADGQVQWSDGTTGSFTLTFDTRVYPALQTSVTKADVDLANRKLVVRANQPVARVELKVVGDDGTVVHDGSVELGEEQDAAVGEPIEVAWEQEPGTTVLKMELKVHSRFGFWSGVEITPFEVEIPHEDVEFTSGAWDIRASESAKLRHTLELLNEKIARYGGFLEMQLYIAGYTDTVGPHGSNQDLSEKRARSIGTWFKSHGLKLPIYYQGFGETVLAVPTGDETDEARNRRALYVLGASAPAPQPSLPRSAWKRL
ncbi:MAG: OmpA family protein [Myxococcales bacterium]|nr:OmpA family protein [Myxococcales bacterium]